VTVTANECGSDGSLCVQISPGLGFPGSISESSFASAYLYTGGGGSGGSSNSGPQAPAPSRAVCAANLADKYSIAGAAGTIGKQGFFANVFNGVAGNTFSGLTLAFSGGGNKYRLGTSINNATFGGTGAAINAVTTPAPITELGLTETVGGESWAKVSVESSRSQSWDTMPHLSAQLTRLGANELDRAASRLGCLGATHRGRLPVRRTPFPKPPPDWHAQLAGPTLEEGYHGLARALLRRL
jgi:hypothetical protein